MSRTFAALNIQNSCFIVLASLSALGVQRLLGWTIPQVFLALAVANALVAIWIFTIVPEFLMRFLSWLLVRSLYRLRPRGIDHIPDDGPRSAERRVGKDCVSTFHIRVSPSNYKKKPKKIH